MKKQKLLILLFISSIVLVYFVLERIKQSEIQIYKDVTYEKSINKSKQYLKNIILEKKNRLLRIAISLASNKNIISSLKYSNSDLVDLKSISNNIAKLTPYNNLWIQIISTKGISLQRSWTKKSGDNLLNARLDLKKIMETRIVISSISVGKYNMTFKAILPIFDGNLKFVGVVEVISNFNSIAKKVQKTGVIPIFLADKMYRQQLTKANTNNFVEDYYISNSGANREVLKALIEEGIEEHINKFKQHYYHFNHQLSLLAGYYAVPDINNKVMGHLLLFTSLDKLEISKIEQIESSYNRYIFIFSLLVSLLFFISYEISPKQNPDIREQNQHRSQKTIIILSLAFLAFSFAISQFIFYRYNSEIRHYKQLTLDNILSKYDLINNKNKQQALLIYESILNNQQVSNLVEQKQRNKLEKLLEKEYRKLVDNFYLRQLHFHLKNSDSFLRMHKPLLYGDSLKKIRPSVDYVNATNEIFSGFEEGRIYNGFRNVFPLNNKNNEHIGSVEVSFGADKFISDMLVGANKKANFLIRKDIVSKKVFLQQQNNYIDSPINGFYFDKKVSQKLSEENLNYNFTIEPSSELTMIGSKLLKGESFIEYFKGSNDLVSFIPIKNKISGEVVASIIIMTNSSYIKNQLFNANVNILISIILLAIVFLFTYREIISRHKAENLARHSKQILDSQESLIFITNGKKMVEANRALLDYLGYQSLNDFFKDHDCICDLFEDEPGKNYLQAEMGGESWISYIMTSDKSPKVKITNPQGDTKIFKIDHSDYAEESEGHIVSFLDITEIESNNYILKQRISDAIKENRDKDQMLQQQSKLASMGEMIGAIAHQWRQPLNELNINIQNLDDDFEDELIDKPFIDQFIKTNRKVILFMSKTIDDFRNFFRIDKVNEKFSIKEAINATILLQSAQLKNYSIDVNIEGNDFKIDGFKSEFQQVILNLINNAKDALLDKKVENGKIDIYLEMSLEKIIIEDNAGGIPEDILDRIFEPYFTTKQQGDGTGMGLYMSKMIIEMNMGGKISVKNTPNGAEFTISFKS